MSGAPILIAVKITLIERVPGHVYLVLPSALEPSVVLILRRRRRGPATQLFQPFSQVISVGSSSHTVLTVWAVDSQEGQQATDPTS